MYEEVQNITEEIQQSFKQEEIAELIYAQSKTEIESTTVQYSWQCTVSLLSIQYI
jgi:predicted HAD superfamily Cof-like phosphohydrolase